MAVIGTITCYADNGTDTFDTFGFYNAAFPEHGFPLVEAVHQIDPVNAMGVNFTRHRIIREDVDPFTAIFNGDSDNWNNAVSRAKYVRKYKGRYISLSYTAGGVTFNLINKFVVKSVIANPMPGHVVSPNVSYEANQAIVTATFVLQYSGVDIA